MGDGAGFSEELVAPDQLMLGAILCKPRIHAPTAAVIESRGRAGALAGDGRKRLAMVAAARVAMCGLDSGAEFPNPSSAVRASFCLPLLSGLLLGSAGEV